MKYLKLTLLTIISSLFFSCEKQQEPNVPKDLKSEIKTVTNKKKNPCTDQVYPCFYEDDLNLHEYIGTFYKDENKIFQSIYSSQNYGTFYHVYCRAKYYKNEDDTEEYMDTLELRILNNKGEFNIGFAENDDEQMVVNYNEKTKNLGLKLVVQGSNNNNAVNISVRDKNIKKVDLEKINVLRMLVYLNKDGAALSEAGIFDSEFYYRSGIGQPITKKLMPGQQGYELNDRIFETFLLGETNDSLPIKLLAEGKNCYSSEISTK